MLVPPRYQLTPQISKSLQAIESAKEVINSISIPAEIETNIRRESTLKSSLFSARIEGNPLTLEEIITAPSKSQRQVEVFNILKALNAIHKRGRRDLSLSELLNLHKLVLNNLEAKIDLGKFRTELSAIYNTAGIAIYLPPRPAQITPLLSRLIKYINSSKEQFVPIKACLAHYTFEKVHPFIDGNGRVGRLLLQAILEKEGYGMKGLLAIEEQLDTHRSDYYNALDISERDVTEFLEFMLISMEKASIYAKEQVLKKQSVRIEDLLLPRRSEILNIIQDHHLINFDIIRRRFMQVNERTLRYDLKSLVDQGLVKKRGTTKGVYYEAKT